MSDFKAKMHQIHFRLWLRHPAGGAYSAPPDPIAGFKGPTSKGREGREGKEKEGKGMGEGGRFDDRGGKEKEERGGRRERAKVGRQGEGKGRGKVRGYRGARKMICPGARAGSRWASPQGLHCSVQHSLQFVGRRFRRTGSIARSLCDS